MIGSLPCKFLVVWLIGGMIYSTSISYVGTSLKSEVGSTVPVSVSMNAVRAGVRWTLTKWNAWCV